MSAAERPAAVSPVVVTVPLGLLRPGESPRSGRPDPGHVRRLMTARRLPPITVHRPSMRVIDGNHRLHAAAQLGRSEIEVRFFDGTAEEAFVEAVRANVEHGSALSRQERTAAARRIMMTRPDWSDRAVAAAAGLSVKTVAQVRRRASDDIPQLHTRIGLDGRVRPVNGAEGRRRAAEFIRTTPRASLREIAAAAGVSTGTARDVRRRLDRDEDPVPAGLGPPPARRAPAARSAAPRRIAAARPVPPAAEGGPLPTALRGDALLRLRKDPSLRFSEPGRLLLRLLDNRALARGLGEVMASLPPHSRAAVAAAVRECVLVWDVFLRELDSAEYGEAAGA
ncbi:hypothetical protein GCM10009760_45270 [Kitasatospora kazusensis]|uniref:ParB-like N-terminal domain-containing protein n=1 Tax=Kitasatospora kazusensis TaxID=407974 RepID=A0ABP5LTZ9_9ACTN